MNKRIQELRFQAWDYVASCDDQYSKSAADLFEEKFAELIVEQVYDYILNATFDDEPWPSRKDVKQHFGVEEWRSQ